jgi:hypothetical protein
MHTPTPPSEPSPSRPGRPRALDEVKLREIIALITAGFSVERAARYVGCAPSTIRRESVRNKQFNSDLRRASLTAELSPLQAIREAGRKYWRAAAWLLERVDPQRFGKQDVRYVKPEQFEAFTEIIGGVIKEQISSPEERERILDKLEAIGRAAERIALINRDTPPSRRPRNRRRPGELSPDARNLLAEVNRATEEAPRGQSPFAESAEQAGIGPLSATLEENPNQWT